LWYHAATVMDSASIRDAFQRAESDLSGKVSAELIRVSDHSTRERAVAPSTANFARALGIQGRRACSCRAKSVPVEGGVWPAQRPRIHRICGRGERSLGTIGRRHALRKEKAVSDRLTATAACANFSMSVQLALVSRRVPGRPCIFCNQVKKMSGEHIWGDWLKGASVPELALPHPHGLRRERPPSRNIVGEAVPHIGPMSPSRR
jgi:hypothetical protein